MNYVDRCMRDIPTKILAFQLSYSLEVIPSGKQKPPSALYGWRDIDSVVNREIRGTFHCRYVNHSYSRTAESQSVYSKASSVESNKKYLCTLG